MTATSPGTPRGRDQHPPGAGRAVHVGFIGPGDQGLPMAVAVAEASFPLHVWARRPASVQRLGATAATVHATLTELAAACGIVAFCVSTDERIAELCSRAGVLALDVPVSGGRPAAEARALTVLVGGPPEALERWLGSASSRALTLLGEMVTPDTVAHQSAVEDLDVDLFATAMTEAGVRADAVVARAHAGARGLPALLDRLPRTAAGRARSRP